VAIIGILAANAIPQYVKYVKRSRTAEALIHVQQAYNALADWYSNPDMGNGRPIQNTLTQAGIGGLTFAKQFPIEYTWLVLGGGDKYYTYIFGSSTGTGAGAVSNGSVPVVIAIARSSDTVFGMVVKSRGGGNSTVLAISSTY